MVQMHNPLTFAGAQAALQRAGFASLIARQLVAVRYLVTGAADDALLPLPLVAVGLVGGQNPVVAVAQDVRLAERFEKGHQFDGGDGGYCHLSAMA